MRTDYYSETNHQFLFSIYDSSKKRKKNQFRNHKHSDLEFGFIISGSGTYLLNQTPLQANTGDLFIVRPNELHCIPTITSDHLIAFNLHFSSYYLWNICADFIEPYKIHALIHSEVPVNQCFRAHDRLNALIQMISELFHEDAEKNRFKIRKAVLELVTVIANEIIVDKPDVNLHNIRFQDVQTAINYIRQNYSRPITLDDISRAAAMSRSYFSGSFKSVTGTTPYEYLLTVRIEKACRLLKQTDLGVLQIATGCGFSNITNFNRAFKQKMGETPSSFRQRNRL